MMKDVCYGSLGEGEDREDQKLFGQYVQGKICVLICQDQKILNLLLVF